jgi:hypothetical protein
MISAGLQSLVYQIYFFGAPSLLNELMSTSLIQDGVPYTLRDTKEGITYFKIERERMRFCQEVIS